MTVEERLSALEERQDKVETALGRLLPGVGIGTRTCEVCGASLEGKKRGARYCSAAHRIAASKARRAA